MNAVTLIFLDESLNPFLESARIYLKFVCDEILAHAW